MTRALRRGQARVGAGRRDGSRSKMRVVIQRVAEASVEIDGKVAGTIGRGLLILLGVRNGDTSAEARQLAEKCVNLRIFGDAEGRFNLSALDVGGEVLVVSQFTLYGDTRKGRRPSFVEAAPPTQAEELFNYFVGQARATGLKVATGRFQQHMHVEIHNDGPVTIWLDSKDKF